jgi:hypothetical protein
MIMAAKQQIQTLMLDQLVAVVRPDDHGGQASDPDESQSTTPDHDHPQPSGANFENFSSSPLMLSQKKLGH